jgi:probable phosphoglycerate mutase
MPIVYLLRHAQSTANTKGILAGRDNSVELTKKGFKQAKNLVPVIEQLKVAKIYCSPLTRCIQTIDPYMQKRANTLFDVDKRLIEMDYGSWSGKKLSSLASKRDWRIVQSKPSRFTFPKGESFRSMRARVESILKELSNQKQPILLVTHGDVIKMFLAVAIGLKTDDFQRFVVEPGSISTISINKGSYSIVSSNTNSSAALNNPITNVIGGGDFIAKGFKWWNR